MGLKHSVSFAFIEQAFYLVSIQARRPVRCRCATAEAARGLGRSFHSFMQTVDRLWTNYADLSFTVYHSNLRRILQGISPTRNLPLEVFGFYAPLVLLFMNNAFAAPPSFAARRARLARGAPLSAGAAFGFFEQRPTDGKCGFIKHRKGHIKVMAFQEIPNGGDGHPKRFPFRVAVDAA